jgi:hypothetical protein
VRWTRKGYFTLPSTALRHHAVCVGASGSGKTETLYRCAYGAYKVYGQQVVYLDAKGESKRDEEKQEDSAARFMATMRAAGAQRIGVFPATYYDGRQGTLTDLQNRLLSIIDFSESAYYGDVAANVVFLALNTPVAPRSSTTFLNNLHLDRLKVLYKGTPLYARVAGLDEKQVSQVRMRYEVFFNAMAGHLDGTLRYTDYDAVYLRVRGFTLRNEAPRLGRFLVADFMHYIAERRRAGMQTLFIIDEFNALRMREETSILFEQVRSFGGSLLISAQGYTGLGPHEYADRILDAANTYIVHACSDPFPIVKRAGKHFVLETSWSEQDSDTGQRRHLQPHWDWKVSEDAVKQQDVGQAFWLHRGRTQQVQMVRVPTTTEAITQAWDEIRQQEQQQEIQQQASLPSVVPQTPVQRSIPTGLNQGQQKPRQKNPPRTPLSGNGASSSSASSRLSKTAKTAAPRGNGTSAQTPVSPAPTSGDAPAPSLPSPDSPLPVPQDAPPSTTVSELDDDGPEYL